MPKVHLFAGESGGIGKSTCTSAAIAYHQLQGLDCVIFDCDRSKPDVYRAHKSIGCRRAVFSEAEHLQNGPNAIFEAALEKTALVNMAAASFVAFVEWLKTSDILLLATEYDVTFYMWFVTDGSPSSNKLLAQSIKHFKGAVPHVVVKNHGRTRNWQLFETDTALSALLKASDTPVIDFPKFQGTVERQTVADQRLSLVAASRDKSFGIISRQRIKKFIRESGEAFASIGLFE